MIKFRRGIAFKAIFYWWGGVNRHIFKPTMMYLVFLCSLTWIQMAYPEIMYQKLKKESIHAFASFVVFLLVFKLNQCMARHNLGKDGTAHIFACLENFVVQMLTGIRGAAGVEEGCTDKRALQHYADMATVHKLNIVRLTIAWAISWRMHCILDTAAAECEGEMCDTDLDTITFLYCRLKGLLYSEEMEMVNRSMCVYAMQDAGLERIIRADVNRRVVKGEVKNEHVLFGHVPGDHIIAGPMRHSPTEDSHCPGQTVTHLPKVIIVLLADCARLPLDQPWGYFQRQLNYTIFCLNFLMEQKALLDCLITMPLPLAYLQHCRVLLAIFAFCHPFSIDPSEGLLDNVVMPFFLFWAIMGFEVLAELMENPLGDDETDLNCMQMIHSLEACAQHAFDLSECQRFSTRRALRRPFHDFMMASADFAEAEAEKEGVIHYKRFEDYFHWLRMPTLILGGLIESHGSVDAVHLHYARCPGCLPSVSRNAFRTTLRKVFRRSQKHMRNLYEAVDTEAQAMSRERRGTDAEDGDTDLVGLVENDPNFFLHYLAFAGCLRAHGDNEDTGAGPTPEIERHAVWKERAEKLLQGRSALSLLTVCDIGVDSERSVCCPGETHAKLSKHLSQNLESASSAYRPSPESPASSSVAKACSSTTPVAQACSSTTPFAAGGSGAEPLIRSLGTNSEPLRPLHPPPVSASSVSPAALRPGEPPQRLWGPLAPVDVEGVRETSRQPAEAVHTPRHNADRASASGPGTRSCSPSPELERRGDFSASPSTDTGSLQPLLQNAN